MNSDRIHDCLPDTFYPRWPETLLDGSHVLIRPIHPEDAQAEREFIEGLSPAARHFRFLGTMSHPSDQVIEQLTDIDYTHEMAFIATIRQEEREKIVGVSRYSADAAGRNCECAVTVADEWQNRGLGTTLLKHLIEVARGNGIRRMYSIDLTDNIRMRELANHVGFHTRIDPDDSSQVIHEIDLATIAASGASAA